ncbi:Retrovirus-related Pol polyprotein from transposon TNT 1-94 [Cucumis melo var. makuwa]|uniref:Retrovirus-related Pol polyprotein from transposon TNT 1-94 n=1 Tax=Cucumis melo var. makuwa TaxID=1194695 RepID=A0A5A7VGV9_CUCMM|nr:Retrovirus-related Pol polyprotein from transposon TNT 1-94 [Cucumis melo var. makuwa]TYJ97151.1 Retrovirus-related Pol polyprotein from transposon TNT 1-94 [Cucumis melo var. makuwa]
MAATHNWSLHQLHIKNAFLHSDLQEEVYMEQPPGFVAQGESDKVCRLRKSLYGLKQSPHAWFVLLIVYVDDIVITGNDASGGLEPWVQYSGCSRKRSSTHPNENTLQHKSPTQIVTPCGQAGTACMRARQAHGWTFLCSMHARALPALMSCS